MATTPATRPPISDGAWTDQHEDALKNRWRAELARGAGGCRTVEEAACIEGAVLCRRILLEMGAVAAIAEYPDLLRLLMAEQLVGLARRFRALGLKRDDVHRLDLGRRCRKNANA